MDLPLPVTLDVSEAAIFGHSGRLILKLQEVGVTVAGCEDPVGRRYQCEFAKAPEVNGLQIVFPRHGRMSSTPMLKGPKPKMLRRMPADENALQMEWQG